MFCKNCGAAMEEKQAMCMKCGAKAGEGKAFCSNCAATIDENSEVCLNCGVAANQGAYLNGKDKVIMCLITVYLGPLGVHNFMLGEVKKGLIKIVGTLCCGIVGAVLATYDLYKILCDRYEIDPEKFI